MIFNYIKVCIQIFVELLGNEVFDYVVIKYQMLI